LRQRRALEVLDGANLLGHLQALRVRDGRHALLAQLVNRVLVFAQIQLRADQNHGRVGCVMANLWVPLRIDQHPFVRIGKSGNGLFRVIA
jgi:hypothetical protein